MEATPQVSSSSAGGALNASANQNGDSDPTIATWAMINDLIKGLEGFEASKLKPAEQSSKDYSQLVQDMSAVYQDLGTIQLIGEKNGSTANSIQAAVKQFIADMQKLKTDADTIDSRPNLDPNEKTEVDSVEAWINSVRNTPNGTSPGGGFTIGDDIDNNDYVDLSIGMMASGISTTDSKGNVTHGYIDGFLDGSSDQSGTAGGLSGLITQINSDITNGSTNLSMYAQLVTMLMQVANNIISGSNTLYSDIGRKTGNS